MEVEIEVAGDSFLLFYLGTRPSFLTNLLKPTVEMVRMVRARVSVRRSSHIRSASGLEFGWKCSALPPSYPFMGEEGKATRLLP